MCIKPILILTEKWILKHLQLLKEKKIWLGTTLNMVLNVVPFAAMKCGFIGITYSWKKVPPRPQCASLTGGLTPWMKLKKWKCVTCKCHAPHFSLHFPSKVTWDKYSYLGLGNLWGVLQSPLVLSQPKRDWESRWYCLLLSCPIFSPKFPEQGDLRQVC